MKRIGDRIRELREGLGLTQADLARRAGVSWETLNRVETGRTWGPQRTTVLKLAAALGMDADGLSEEPPNAEGVEDGLVAGIAQLAPEERRAIEALVRALLRGQRARERPNPGLTP